MNKKERDCGACASDSKNSSCCRIEAMITVDEKGQMVMPKDLRERAGIRPGEKFALISWEKDGGICCFTLIKADALSGGIRDFLGPVMQGVFRTEPK